MDEDTDRLEERGHQDMRTNNAMDANGHDGDGNAGAYCNKLLTQMRVVQSFVTDRAEHVALGP